MTKKVTDIVSYLTIIGWLVAFLAGDKENSKFHLNQSLCLAIIELVLGVAGATLGRFFLFGIVLDLLGLGVFVLAIIGIVYAVQEQEKALPLVGGIQLLK